MLKIDHVTTDQLQNSALLLIQKWFLVVEKNVTDFMQGTLLGDQYSALSVILLSGLLSPESIGQVQMTVWRSITSFPCD